MVGLGPSYVREIRVGLTISLLGGVCVLVILLTSTSQQTPANFFPTVDSTLTSKYACLLYAACEVCATAALVKLLLKWVS